jgi:ADP-ribosylglycohydrolase/predicted enzyme related to lactoylglutathione lyase
MNRTGRVISALLGAALGDALGWPHENRARRIQGSVTDPADGRQQFLSWTRANGSRYSSHEEIIQEGEYSDDTQLLLCTARSVLWGSDWWKRLANVEIPTWLLYERGAGSAVKRAANSLLKLQVPWKLPRSETAQYFAAGGNGVAMRILPHCIIGANDDSFESTARNIFLNGALTHGHPRALLGALAYGFAVWTAFRTTHTVGYGEILQNLEKEFDTWSALPSSANEPPGWYEAAQDHSDGMYLDIWKQTAGECQELLQISSLGIRQASIASDMEVLQSLGALDPKINGSGTITAFAAAYLSSRYAVDPISGVMAAALARGSDTDTVASMTGGLLGSLVDVGWPTSLISKLQDADYLRQLAQQLNLSEGRLGYAHIDTIVKTTDLQRCKSKLWKSQEGSTLELPDGREATVRRVQSLTTRTGSFSTTQWFLDTADGQSLYIKQSRKLPRENDRRALQPAIRAGVRLHVANINISAKFYKDIVGFVIENQTPVSALLGNVIQLINTSDSMDELKLLNSHKDFIIYIEVPDVHEVFKRVKANKNPILEEIRTVGTRQFFKCLDPDGFILEISSH